MDDTRLSDIVVATDGSDPAAAAVEAAIGLAAGTGARLHACTVVNPFPTGQKLTDLRDHREEAEERVKSIASRAEEAGVDAVATLREGVPADELLACVDEVGADVVVVGTHGRGGARRVLLGSVAEAIVRTADVPVLVVHGDGERREWGSESRLVVATDGSDAVVPAERIGVDLAATLGARLTAVSAIDEARTLANVGGGVLTNETIESVKRALSERAGDAVDRVLERAEDAGLDADAEMIAGEPSRAVCGYARDADADLVVVGTHGRTGVRRVVLGSVAERILRAADRPVLVVPASAETFENAEGSVDAEAGADGESPE
ncbi:universal stress protein [Halobaculum gomorrense]|uniref:Nucleotide-binding universal stress protein, UspA family n=1 Tax=Halobaculum gomorrense TaxID=43928 RepID=A0A1M5N2E1_9EURY|nr:universal stress protein [Halobaculum gomorrense]SHG83756.1 Nucleotide-binding universal stress protein, UspA family [Halobaculum gomorrense]